MVSVTLFPGKLGNGFEKLNLRNVQLKNMRDNHVEITLVKRKRKKLTFVLIFDICRLESFSLGKL